MILTKLNYMGFIIYFFRLTEAQPVWLKSHVWKLVLESYKQIVIELENRKMEIIIIQCLLIFEGK